MVVKASSIFSLETFPEAGPKWPVFSKTLKHSQGSHSHGKSWKIIMEIQLKVMEFIYQICVGTLSTVLTKVAIWSLWLANILTHLVSQNLEKFFPRTRAQAILEIQYPKFSALICMGTYCTATTIGTLVCVTSAQSDIRKYRFLILVVLVTGSK